MAGTDLELPRRILVVEDDPQIRHMLQKTFETGAEVKVAEDGRRGLELLASWRPEFMITDLMLPEMDGLELIKTARRTYFGACVPILVLTANAGENVLLDCFREGADDFMVKPFSLSELRVRVSSIHLRQQVARDLNPLTRLPGNMVIKNEVNQRLTVNEPFAIAYLDLDHFKAFNDTRGFDLGDEVIKELATILIDYSLEHSDEDIWIGHVGGDDFVALLPPDTVDRFGDAIIGKFASIVPGLYEDDDVKRGTVDIVTRTGDLQTVPLLSLSIGVVSSERQGIDDFRRITEIAAEVKHQAKMIEGNSLFIDRRRVDEPQ